MVIVAGTLAGARRSQRRPRDPRRVGRSRRRRQHLVRDRQVGGRAHRQAALQAREGPTRLRLGRAAARGARQLHHPRRALHPLRADRGHVLRRLHARPALASVLRATTSSPAGSGRSTRRCSATSAASSSRSSRGRACCSGSRSRSRSRSRSSGCGTAGEAARLSATTAARQRPGLATVRRRCDPRHRGDRVPRLASCCARAPRRDRRAGRGSRRSGGARRCSSGVRPDVVIHTAYRQDGTGARRDRRRRLRERRARCGRGRSAAHPPLDGRRLRRPQGPAVRRGGRALAVHGVRPREGRGGGARRGGRARDALRRAHVADRRGPGHEPSKHELAAHDPEATFYEDEIRSPVQVSDLARHCSSSPRSTSPGRSTSPERDDVSRAELAELVAGAAGRGGRPRRPGGRSTAARLVARPERCLRTRAARRHVTRLAR